jgi:ArsR family transcriptional regulator, arsenate/arsenite/antimonite-responsive transcriptional repressor
MKANYSQAIPDQWQAMAKVFVALGDPHRQRIVLLFERGERLNVGQIVAVATITRSAVSHHLKVLHDAGVLQSEKVGKEVYFWINKAFVEDTMQHVLDYVREST